MTVSPLPPVTHMQGHTTTPTRAMRHALALILMATLLGGHHLMAQEKEEHANGTPTARGVPAAPDFVPPPPPPGPPPTLPPDYSRRGAPASARGATRAEQIQSNYEEIASGFPTPTIGRIDDGSMPLHRRVPTAPANGNGDATPATPTPAPTHPGADIFPATTSQPTAQSTDEEATIGTIILSDSDYNSVFLSLEEMTGKAILRPQNLPAVKLNFNSQGPMTKSDAILALTSLLSLNGIVITEMGDKFLKAMPAGNAAMQVPTFINGSTLGLPPSQAYYTKLFKLEYLNLMTEAQTIITPLMSAQTQGAYVPFAKTNSVLITDTLVNLQRIESVLKDADRPQIPEEEILFFQLDNVKATELQARLNAMIQNQSSSLHRYFSHNTTLEADERTNQLIVMTHPANVPMLSQIVEKLDINIAPNTTSRVLYIKHAKATEIASLVKEVISGQQQQQQQAADARTAAARRQAAQQQQQQQGQPQTARNLISTGIDTSNMRFSEFTVVVADERSNAVVIYGTQSDLDQIESLVEQIDVLLAQVHIQVIIAEVKLSENELDGISSLGLNYSAAQGFSGRASGPTASQISAPFEFIWAFDTSTVESVIRDSVIKGKATILSAPVIVTTHNQEASVNVSESRPFIEGSITSGEGSGGAITNSVRYRDVGITLTVTPLIGNNGMVQMEINQLVETIVPAQGVIINDVEQPFIDKREATSFISVAHRQTIILAGLQQSEVGNSRGKLWLLGDIPLLGDWIFSNRRVSDNRRELMMFITPSVIYNQQDATQLADQAIQNLDNSRDIEIFMETRDITSVYELDKADQEAELTPAIFRNTHGPRR